MKKFIVKIILFFLIVGVVDFFYGMTYDFMNSHAKGGENKRVYDLCKKDKYDILIMGSSRAHHHYVPSIIEEETGMSCYNAGFDGNGVILAYGFLQQIVKRYRPKLIIYDIEPAFDISVYLPDNDRTRYLSLQKPYYRDSDVAKIFKDVAIDEYYKVHSGLYRYNSACLTGLSSFLSNRGNDTLKGYEPLYGEMKEDVNKGLIKDTSQTDENKLEYISKFIDLANNKQIPLIIVASPKYLKESSAVYNEVKEMCMFKDVPFLDYYHLTDFMEHKEYFKEPMHLNDKGAKEFTKHIVSQIQTYLNNQ